VVAPASRERDWRPWAVVLGTTVILGLVSLIYPFGRDQGMHAYIADWALKGSVMYRDIFMGILPFTAVVHVISLLLFGHSMAGIRIFDLFWTAATALGVYGFVRNGFGRRWPAIIAGVMYPFVYYQYDFWHTAQNDGFLNLPLVLAMFLAVRLLARDKGQEARGGMAGWWFLSGLLAASALFFKFTVGLALISILVVTHRRYRRSKRSPLKPMLWFGAGCAATVLGVVMALAAFRALPGFLEGLTRSTAPYSRQGNYGISFGARFILMLQSYTRPAEYQLGAWLGLLGLIPALGLLLGRKRIARSENHREPKESEVTMTSVAESEPGMNRSETGAATERVGDAKCGVENPSGGDSGLAGAAGGSKQHEAVLHSQDPASPELIRSTALLVILWLISGLASVFIQGKLFFYHYLPILPPIAILAALTIDRAATWIARVVTRDGPRIALLAVAVIGLVLTTNYYDRYQQFLAVMTGSMSWRDYWNDHGNQSTFSVVEQMDVADYIRATTAPRDHVFVWGIDPLVDYFAGRWFGSRFIYTHPLAARWSPSACRTELLNTWRTDPPELLVTEHEDRLPSVMDHNLDSYETLLSYDEIRAFVIENYELERSIGQFDILRHFDSDRRSTHHAGPPDARLAADLDEALQFIVARKLEARTITWPIAVPIPAAVAPEARPVLSRMISQRSLNRNLWLREQSLDSLLPALSVWIRGDDRPFATQEPFGYQGEGQNYIAGDCRFTLLHTCRDGLVFVYDIRPVTGSEATRQMTR
jgi:hypothetical protein